MATSSNRQDIDLGDRVQDRITKLKGIVIAITFWLNGCVRMVVQPEELKDGKPVDTSNFDVEELILLKKNAITQKSKRQVTTNGPMPEISRREQR